ncbi:MAG: PP2C family protein-serine/threonine phosphatase [Myxococcota bacterium]
MSLRYAAASDSGPQRTANEDSLRTLPELGLFIVADGMGGHVAGEVASRIASDAVVHVVRSTESPDRIRDEAERLGEALIACNQAVLREADRLNLAGMGTTLTALLVRGSTVTMAHVGDTRAYLVLPEELRQLTKDHTLVNLLVDSGAIELREVATHPERHVLTQAIGTQSSVQPDVIQLRVSPESRILLSSDGLHDVVPPDRIHELASAPELDAIPQSLIAAANQLGGPDNITAILVEP